MFKIISLLIISVFLSVGNLWADSLEMPKGKVILTIAGNIEKTNINDTAQFDLPMLLAFKQHEINTKTPWTQGINKFEGPTINDLIDHVVGDGQVISATALNGYRIMIPTVDVTDYPVIIALKRNDEILSVRKKGPGWVIYPWDENKELRDNLYYTRAIWQLKYLEIK